MKMVVFRTVILWWSTIFLILSGALVFLYVTGLSQQGLLILWSGEFMLLLLITSASLNLFTPYILKWFYNCRILDHRVAMREFRLVLALQQLARESGLPTPTLLIQNRDEVNAFSTGLHVERSYIVLTQGLVDRLNHKQVLAIMAHELMHIRNGDMCTLSLMQASLYVVSTLPANLVYFMIERWIFRRTKPSILYYLVYSICYIVLLWPAALFVSWYSRRQEFQADRLGAQLIGQENMRTVLSILRSSEVTDTVPNYFLAFKSPLSAMNYFKQFFSTHASLEERLTALKKHNK